MLASASAATRPACRSTIDSKVCRAVRPLPNAGPLGSSVKYFTSASPEPGASRYSWSSACCSTIRSSSPGT